MEAGRIDARMAAASSSLVGMEGFGVVGGLSRFFFSFGFLVFFSL